jgi:pimeloyl-ACP methyl ester carboxylesterase
LPLPAAEFATPVDHRLASARIAGYGTATHTPGGGDRRRPVRWRIGRMPYLSHGGHSLRYERAGAGLPILFLHGLMGNHTFWDRQQDLRRQLQVVRMDLRGHGDSSKPRGSYAMATLATDVEHLVGALGLQRCLLVGWSMGGMIALESVRLLGSKVAGLVLVGTTPCPAAGDAMPDGLTPEQRQEFLTGVDSDYRAFARDLAGRLFRSGQTGLLQWAAQQLLRTPPYVARAALEGFFGADRRDVLASLAVPTLVCHGRHDAIFPFSIAEYVHRAIRGSELVAFENSGHAPMIEETARFNEVLASFAERVLSKTSPGAAGIAAHPGQPRASAGAETAEPATGAATAAAAPPSAARPTAKRAAPPKGSPAKKRARTPPHTPARAAGKSSTSPRVPRSRKKP